jgi:uncharacterized protein (DUF924 family)
MEAGLRRRAGEEQERPPPGRVGVCPARHPARAEAESGGRLSIETANTAAAAPPTFAEARAVSEFWFDPKAEKLWFEKNDAFDDEIRQRFAPLIERAASGEFSAWERHEVDALALVIILDQFPRNIYRGSPLAYVNDAPARQVAGRAIDRGFHLALPRGRRFFFYLPFEHSEDLIDQARSLTLFREWVEESPPEKRAEADHHFTYILRHEEIIRRFGRFPHRNAALGRETTPEEAEFLKEPRSSF